MFVGEFGGLVGVGLVQFQGLWQGVGALSTPKWGWSPPTARSVGALAGGLGVLGS